MNAKTPPNILFIFADQMRANAMHCMGTPDVMTPNLDRLATDGVTFTNAIANSPICGPARACMLTGRYCHATGQVVNDLRLPPDEVCIAKELGRHGYRTGFIGKWHLDGGRRHPGYVPPGPRRQGFDFWAANECNHKYYDSVFFRDPPDPVPLDGRYETEVLTDWACEFLDSQNRDRPFFLTLAYGAPHNPYAAPERYTSLYDAAHLTLPPNFHREGRVPLRDLALYYAMITAIDEQIGRILRELERLGQRESTIVFFSSDHGDLLGSHGLFQKRFPYDESVRVPGIMRWDGHIAAGRIDDTPFSHVDFCPTLLGMCGVGVPAAVQGSDLSMHILGEQGPRPDAAYLEIFGPCVWQMVPDGWRGIRTERYTYARFRERPWMLFDRRNDPWEMENLVAEPACRSMLDELDGRLAKFMAQTGDSWSENWREPLDDDFPLCKLPAFERLDQYRAWAASAVSPAVNV